MRKIFWPALAAFGLLVFSASANAADSGVKLGLGGYYKAGLGVIVNDDDGGNFRNHSINKMWKYGSPVKPN
ncbi:MAG: hypothetical protein EYC62_03715 [Alphaproteobacteria bacterium]|nr:MAG: hypothetical protein EYC62_03715 [Alphaproteobacteria bacterium]